LSGDFETDKKQKRLVESARAAPENGKFFYLTALRRRR